MRILTYLTIILLALGSACSTASLNIEERHAISKIRVEKLGKGATVAEVRSIFGKPEMIVPSDKGEVYFYKDLSLNSYWVEFSAEGRVIDFEWSN